MALRLPLTTTKSWGNNQESGIHAREGMKPEIPLRGASDRGANLPSDPQVSNNTLFVIHANHSTKTNKVGLVTPLGPNVTS
jgi:hypothetical protein